jgi:hypothetical protein
VRGPYRDRLRATIVRAAEAGQNNAVIAAGLGIYIDTVRKWRRRPAAGAGRCAAQRPPAASSRSRRPRSAGGWPATPSSPGSAGPGSPSVTRSSLLDQAGRVDLAAGFAAEQNEIAALIGSPNQVEAVAAEFAKRPSRFTDPG